MQSQFNQNSNPLANNPLANPLARSNSGQITTANTLRKAGTKSYNRLQETAQAMEPLVSGAVGAAAKAKTTLTENVFNPLGAFMGQAKTQL